MESKILDAFVTIVFVADEKVDNVVSKLQKLTSLLKKNYANYEVLLIDNGLLPKDVEAVATSLKEIACIRVMRLSKIGESDTAVFAGVEAAIGDYICVLYNEDPAENIPAMIERLRSKSDIIFGVATNLRRQNKLEDVGARMFYWYNRKFLKIDIPHGATYFIGMNRTAVNALTRSGRYSKHIRYLAKQIGFEAENFYYKLPKGKELYSTSKNALALRAINLVSSYSSHPLRALTYFGIFASATNLLYAAYVVLVNISQDDIARGWTTLSMQSSIMFFFLFLIVAIILSKN